MKYPFTRPGLDDAAGDIAGTHDGVIAIVRHVEAVEHALHRSARPRCVGDKDHRPAAGAKARQRVAGFRKGRNAVVYNSQTSQKSTS